MEYTISYEQQGRFKHLSSNYQHLLTIDKANAENISKCIKYDIKEVYDYLYNIYIDRENGKLIFVHDVVYTVSAFGENTEVECATVISFNTLKEVIYCQMDFYKLLVDKLESENNVEKAIAYKEYITKLKKIIDTYETDWKQLIR